MTEQFAKRCLHLAEAVINGRNWGRVHLVVKGEAFEVSVWLNPGTAAEKGFGFHVDSSTWDGSIDAGLLDRVLADESKSTGAAQFLRVFDLGTGEMKDGQA